jgi:hypothetical protein
VTEALFSFTQYRENDHGRNTDVVSHGGPFIANSSNKVAFLSPSRTLFRVLGLVQHSFGFTRDTTSSAEAKTAISQCFQIEGFQHSGAHENDICER